MSDMQESSTMKSYFHQPGNIPYVFETIPERIKKLAEESPDKTAIVVYHSKEERYEITRKELYDKSLKFAQVLIQLGIRKGDRVAYCVSNSIDWMVYDVGIMMAGGVSVYLLMDSIDVNITLTSCIMIILDSKERWDNFLGVAAILPGGKIICDACPSLKLAMAVFPDSRPANALLASELMAEIKDDKVIDFTQLPVLDPEDVAFIHQTSGTTGIPKKVCHSHFDLVNNVSIFCKIAGITGDDIYYINRPMAYSGGYPTLFIGIGTTILTGDVGFLNNPDNMFTVEDIWKTECCTIIHFQPQSIKTLRDCGFRVKLLYSGGDMITKDMIRNSFVLADTFGIIYGSTETYLIAYESYSKETISQHPQDMIGFPLPGVEVKIVNEKEEIINRGQIGTLCIRCPWNTKLYDSKQVSPLKNGWFHTNDLCCIEPDGKILMKGRKSSFIIKGTVNVSIQLLEDYVGSHPDVQQVAVVGVPDSRFGEDICACVKIISGCTFDANALKEYCEKKMSSKTSLDWISMVPSYFIPFNVLPNLLTTKLDRKKIKNMAIKHLNLK